MTRFHAPALGLAPGPGPLPQPVTRPAQRRWPLLLIGASAGTATWSGWVGLGELVGFGIVHPLPGIADGFTINTAITLPIGVEAYAVYALSVATSTRTLNPRTRAYAWASAIGALILGMGGQITYHLMQAAAGHAHGPWQIVAVVSCLPVIVLGAASVLWHLTSHPDATPATSTSPAMAEETRTAPPDGTVTVSAPQAPGGHEHPTDLGKPTPRREPRRATTKTPTRPRTADRVARLRARHPGWTAAQIAERIDVSERTVWRYLRDLDSDTAPDTATDSPADTHGAEHPDTPTAPRPDTATAPRPDTTRATRHDTAMPARHDTETDTAPVERAA